MSEDFSSTNDAKDDTDGKENSSSKECNPGKKSLRALDALNVFLADVRDGVGPYLAIFLIATHHWNEGDVGIVMSVAGIAGVIAQTPAGALVDYSKHKRWLIAIGSTLIAISCLAMVVWTTMPVIIVAQVGVGVAASVIGPAVAAITLGLVGRRKLDRRVGRNESFNHAGNVVAAAAAGLLGHFVGREWIFYLVAAMAVAAIFSVFAIKESEINHEVARGADKENKDVDTEESTMAGIKAILSDKRVIAFAASVVLFHFANAAMLPLVGQALAQGTTSGASLYMSACIIAAQLVMIPTTAWAGGAAQTWGRKSVFLIAFIVLPIRGVLYTLTDNPYFLVSVQILDGIAGGIFGVVTLIMIADLMRGTGRFNLAQGAIGTATGIGASLSVLVTGFIVTRAGYNAAFLTLAAVALVALAVFWFFVPETKDATEPDKSPLEEVPQPA